MVTIIIVIVTCIVSFGAFNSTRLMNRWIFDPYSIHHRKEYYRFITSGLLHGSWIHLIINMLVLYSFGTAVEEYYQEIFGTKGVLYFIILYIGGIVISDLPTYKKHQNDVIYKGLGASGAVSAVIFTSIVFQPLAKIYIWGVIGVPGIILGILYLVYSAQMSKRSADNINHDAHFYGAVFGFLFTIAMRPSLLLHFINALIAWI